MFGYALVKLDEIATITRGGNFQKKDFVENGKPCIHYGQMYTHFGIFADKTLTFVNDEVFAKSKIAKQAILLWLLQVRMLRMFVLVLLGLVMKILQLAVILR